MDHMTAKVSCFSRAFHFRDNTDWIYKDDAAGKLLTEEEYKAIATNMTSGISYFAPGFQGSGEEALRFIVEQFLSPSVLLRSAFCERAFRMQEESGVRQVLLFAAGYDSFAFHAGKEIHVFELDQESLIEEKKERVAASGLMLHCSISYLAVDLSLAGWSAALKEEGFHPEDGAFGSLLGISYYLEKRVFRRLLLEIADIFQKDAAICFDYPAYEAGEASRKNRALAAEAREEMKAEYTPDEMKELLRECGFQIRREIGSEEASEEFCEEWNRKNPGHRILAPGGVHYCLAVRS